MIQIRRSHDCLICITPIRNTCWKVGLYSYMVPNIFRCLQLLTKNILLHLNTLYLVYRVATICHQVRCMHLGIRISSMQPRLFESISKRSTWEIYVTDLLGSYLQKCFVCVCSLGHKGFSLNNYFDFNIESYLSMLVDTNDAPKL